MKKFILRLIAVALLIPMTLLVSCGDDEGKDTSSDTKDTVSTSQAELLGFEEQNYDRDFNILLNNTYPITTRDFMVEYSESGLSKVIYERNLACEEYLGITIKFTPEPGHYNSGMPERIYTLVTSGACEYDMVSMALNTGIIGGYIDIYKNIMQMDYMNLDHEWWVQDLIAQNAINNQLYFVTGDACISTYAYIGCVFANLKVADDYNVNVNLYDLVDSGDWTMEEFYRLFKMVGSDDNGDGVYDPLTETYGWCNHNIGVRLMWSSADIELIVRKSDGTFALRDGLDSRILDFVDDIKTAYDDPLSDYTGVDAEMIDAMVDDRVFLVTSYLGKAEDFKANNMESPFAILPSPKYDAEQEDYISTNMPSYNALFFPSTISNEDLSAQVAEFMGWYGKTVVVPEYYDETLKYKNNDVKDNIEMLELIRDKLRVTPNESYGVISGNGADSVMYWTQLTDITASDTGFYSNPSSVWKQQASTIANNISTYILQYFS